MTKDLSKQICEKCGMQLPGKLIFKKRNWDKKCWISAGCGYKKFDFKSQPEVWIDILPDKNWDKKNGFQYPHKQIEEIKKLYDKNGYDFVEFKTESIDFGSPENFVKLYELHILPYTDTNIKIYISAIIQGYTRTDFLIQLLGFLNNSNVPEDKKELIKQSIREAEWKYE